VFPQKIIRHINRILESDTRESIKIRFHILAHFRTGIANRILLLILPVIQTVNIIRAVANSHHAANNYSIFLFFLSIGFGFDFDFLEIIIIIRASVNSHHVANNYSIFYFFRV